MSHSLHEFREAASANDQSRLVELAEGVLDELDRRGERERGIEEAARSVAAEPTVADADRQAAREVVDAVLDAEQVRSTLAMAILGLPSGRFNPTAAARATEAAIEAGERIDRAVDAFRATDAASSLPPVIVAFPSVDVLDVPKGEGGAFEVTVANDGGIAATEISILIDADLAVDVTPSAIPELTAGATASADVAVLPPGKTGEFDVRVRVSDNGSLQDSLGLLVEIRSKADYLERTIDQFDDLQERIRDVVSGLNRPARPFDNRIGKVRQDLEALVAAVEGGDIRGKKAEKRIKRSQKHLNGLRGLVNSLQQVPDGVRDGLLDEVDEIDATLDVAIAAAM